MFAVSVDRKVFGLSPGRHGGRGRNPAFSSGGERPVLKKKPGFFAAPLIVRKLFDLLSIRERPPSRVPSMLLT
ncbi:Uncharacterized protein dnm_033600 [Desulfonema magnum]|uniref:Uncharacterized protein n=1 Tax=Desulfonema magnum TaxID=45655 RepID=A0A975GN29_9BACT|nr:Uncharacterized protein dnm_033600 [Desulfonema magnum]